VAASEPRERPDSAEHAAAAEHAAPRLGLDASTPVDPGAESDVPAMVVPARLTWMAAIALRLLIIAAALFVLAVAMWTLRVVVVPIFVALFLSTVLGPPTAALKRRGVPPLPAAGIVFATAVAFLALVVAMIIPPFVDQFDDLVDAAEAAVDDGREWLRTGPLNLDQSEIDDLFDSAQDEFAERQGDLAAGAMSAGVTAVEVIVGLFITIVLTFFIMKDGDRMYAFGLQQVRPETANDLRHVGERAWTTLTGYFRGTTIDGIVEAVLIGIGLVLLGVPLAFPLAVITFFGGYFPLVGALLAGSLAAAVALVSEGPVTALLVVVLAVVVQNVASNLIDPLVMSRTVRIHPVVVLVSVTSGGILGGIVGAFVAVPLAAVALNVADYYRNTKPAAQASAGDDDAGDDDTGDEDRNASGGHEAADEPAESTPTDRGP
jgi:putative heme transporter